MAPRYQDDASRWGEQKLEVWENYANWMYENKLLEKQLNAKKHSQMNFYQNKERKTMANSLVSIQIIPKTKNGENVIPYVDEAIKIITESGLKYEVHPLETTIEGDLKTIFKLITKMNERMIEIGSKNVISQIKVLYQPSGIAMEDLTEKYR